MRDGILSRYAEVHRKYHTLQHLDECLTLFERMQHAADHPHEVEMALWFHDSIYDLKASDNEQRSAAWAKENLLRENVEAASVERIFNLIMVTKHTGSPQTRDEQVLVDIDLAILGSDSLRFSEYERQIREEYSFVPGFLYRMKRKSVLKAFANRSTIYSTPLLHQELEYRARANLASAIAENAA